MGVSNNTRSNSEKSLWFDHPQFVLLVAIGIIALSIVALAVLPRVLISFNSTGQIGDTFGGIVNPIIGVATAYMMYMAFRQQVLANKKQGQETRKQIELLEDSINKSENANKEQINLLARDIYKKEEVYEQQREEVKRNLELLELSIQNQKESNSKQNEILTKQIMQQDAVIRSQKETQSKEWLLFLLVAIKNIQENLEIAFVGFSNYSEVYKLQDIPTILEKISPLKYEPYAIPDSGSSPFNHMDMSFEYLVLWLGWEKALEMITIITFDPGREGSYNFGRRGIQNPNSPGFPYTWDLDYELLRGYGHIKHGDWDATIKPFEEVGVRGSFFGLLTHISAYVTELKGLSTKDEEKYKALLIGQLNLIVVNTLCNVFVHLYVFNPRINFFGTTTSSNITFYWRPWVELFNELSFIEYLDLLRVKHLHNVDIEAWPRFHPEYVDPRLTDGYQAPEE